MTERPGPSRPATAVDLLFLPVGLLLQAPPLAIGLGVLALGAAGLMVYYGLNSDFFGLAAPAFDALEISGDFEQLRSRADRRSWTITYESPADTTFTGLVRHVSHWREYDIPFTTHDVLVTTGDFADPDRVHTDVSGHRFTYSWPGDLRPQGTIHLLHIVPFDEAIYQKLLDLRGGETVTLSGREILKIDRFAPDGAFLGNWQDDGCNTLLVKAVAVK